MATNSFFESSYSASAEDQALYNDLIVESIKVHGRDMYYLPRTLTNFDEFFGEDAVSAYNDAIVVEFYLENVQGWEGDNKFLSKFGLEIRDEATLIIARSRFAEEVTTNFADIKVPREGDVIVLPSTIDKRTRAFEISYVDGESVFYQLGELYVWKLKIRNFEYNGETFNTGISVIDDYETKNSVATAIGLDVGTGTYSVGETVTSNSWSATVIGQVGDVLTVIVTSGDLLLSDDPIVGQTSGASWTPITIEDTNAQDPGSDNAYIETKEDTIIDFTESDPYSGL